MIEVKKLTYSVDDIDTKETKTILKNINLKFPKGKITCITGHNGSGKSTLLKIIAGIINPTSGNVLFNGENIEDLSISERANKGITMAFQQPVRFKGLKVRDLIRLAMNGNGDDIKLNEACEVLSKVGLCAKDYIDRDIDDTLSGGELKRIELALALAKGGDVFLFDEPEAGIDLWSFESLVNIFKELKEKTVIIVSHQKKVLESADCIVVMDSEKSVVMGTKKEILSGLKKNRCAMLGGTENE